MNKPNELKMILTGLGGQGVVFLTQLLARTALSLGSTVMVSETHGMSQRGGSVISHLRFGDSESPLIQKGTADILIALNLDEALRTLMYVRPNGYLIINSEKYLPEKIEKHLTRLGIQSFTIPADQIALDLGSAKMANVILAGFLSGLNICGIQYEAFRLTLSTLAPQYSRLNLKALEEGFQAGVPKTYLSVSAASRQ